MEYTVKQFAELTGVTPRTLRYYDRIGLLRPARLNAAGYRIYTSAQADRMQDILFYRALDFRLEEIARLLEQKEGRLELLQRHLAALEARRNQMDLLMETVRKTIEQERGGKTLTDQEKFEGLKQDALRRNEARYGMEIRKRYGAQAADAAEAKFRDLSRADYEAMQALEQEIRRKLEAAVAAKSPPDGPQGQELVRIHRRWLSYTWSACTPEAHRGVADLYTADVRFTAYYDAETAGCAAWLRDAIYAWTAS